MIILYNFLYLNNTLKSISMLNDKKIKLANIFQKIELD